MKVLASLILAVGLLSLACSGGETLPPDTVAPPTTTPAQATALPRAGSDWPHPNYDLWNSRATFESAINSGKVALLAEAWRYELPQSKSFGAAATTPIVAGNTVYLGDLLTNVHSIDLATGERRWMAEVDSTV